MIVWNKTQFRIWTQNNWIVLWFCCKNVKTVVVCAPAWRKSSVWDPEISDVRRTDSQARSQAQASESHSRRRAGQERSALPNRVLSEPHRLQCANCNRIELFCILFLATKQIKNQSGKKSVFDKELTNTSKKALKQYRAGFVLVIFLEVYMFGFVRLSNDDGLLCLDLHLKTERDSAFRTRKVDASNPKPSKIHCFAFLSFNVLTKTWHFSQHQETNCYIFNLLFVIVCVV